MDRIPAPPESMIVPSTSNSRSVGTMAGS